MNTEFEIRLEAKLGRIEERLSSIDVTIGKQEVSLGEHIRRTEVAEHRLEKVENAIMPLQTHSNYIEGALKLVGLGSLIATIMMAVFEFYRLIHPR